MSDEIRFTMNEIRAAHVLVTVALPVDDDEVHGPRIANEFRPGEWTAIGTSFQGYLPYAGMIVAAGYVKARDSAS